MFNCDKSSVTLIELTIPFEQNQLESHNRKVNKYGELVITIESKGTQSTSKLLRWEQEVTYQRTILHASGASFIV